MKLKTSFFNPTVFKKDVQRFAPVWALFTVMLLMGLLPVANDGGAYYRATNVASMTSVTGIVAFLYAPLVVQLLFGDLYSARMCNALHALPLRRECWFATHTIAGLAFGWVPYVVLALVGLPVLDLGIAWTVVPLWLLAACGQYLFFFGLSVFCAMMVGNRFSQIIVYGILNFFSLMVFWSVYSLYEPMLLGLKFTQDPFNLFCPVTQFVDSYNTIDVLANRILDAEGYFVDYEILGVVMGEGWGYLAICAVIAVVLLGVSLAAYRRRQLECAGDFIAFAFLEPVFLVFYTFTVGVFFHLLTEMFGVSGVEYLFLAVGLIVGFFTGLMLLKRTTRVFRPKAFVQFAVLAAVFAMTLVLTSIDPLGITRKVPEAADVAAIRLSNSWGPGNSSEGNLEITDPADIAQLLALHEKAIDGDARSTEDNEALYTIPVALEYTLTDGSSLKRYYELSANAEAAQILEGFCTRFEYIMGFPEEEIPQQASYITSVYTNDMWDNSGEYRDFIASLDLESLLKAIAADCAAGNMAQFRGFHLVPGQDTTTQVFSLELGFDEERIDEGTGRVENARSLRFLYFQLYEECTNTLQWLEENGLYDPDSISRSITG